MKRFKTILLAFVTVLATINLSVGQNYKSQFNVNSSGHVENDKGEKLGWIEQDGTIKNAKGEVVGKISKQDKQTELLDKLGKKMGSVSEDGTLKDAHGKVIYTISTADQNGVCKIKDASRKEVGTAHENYKQQGACLYHCLGKKK